MTKKTSISVFAILLVATLPLTSKSENIILQILPIVLSAALIIFQLKMDDTPKNKKWFRLSLLLYSVIFLALLAYKLL